MGEAGTGVAGTEVAVGGTGVAVGGTAVAVGTGTFVGLGIVVGVGVFGWRKTCASVGVAGRIEPNGDWAAEQAVRKKATTMAPAREKNRVK